MTKSPPISQVLGAKAATIPSASVPSKASQEKREKKAREDVAEVIKQSRERIIILPEFNNRYKLAPFRNRKRKFSALSR
jgi:hypothetical protein